MIDVNAMRRPAILLNGLDRADKHYTFYYDETNNIRRLHLTPDGLNVRQPKCFVLGGIAHQGMERALDVKFLRSALNIQENAKEIKLKHLGKGEFLDLLKSRKISIFLDWLHEENLFIHYQVLDVMYWSVVDIVESILTELGNYQLNMSSQILKNDLYSVLRYDLDRTVSLLSAYNYPDVGRERRHTFINELLSLFEAYRENMEVMNYQMLKGVFQMARKVGSLPYLEEENANVLIDEFSTFYINRICLFKNAKHVFDIEKVIQERLATLEFMDEGQSVDNYHFVDSVDQVGVQIADVLVGFLGKAFSYVNQTAISEINDDLSQLSETQSGNLKKLSKLMNCSITENAAFAHYVISGTDQQRAHFLFKT